MTTVTEVSKFWTSSRFWTRRVPSLAAIALAVGLAGCGDVGKTADEYIQSAQEHRLAGEMNAAVIDLKNALQQDPDGSAARFMLGEIYLDIGDGASAEKELVRAQELGMGEAAIALPLARAWLLQGQNDRVLDDLPLPAEDNPQYVTVLVLHGQALLGLGKPDQAEATFNQALEAAPDSLEANIGLARAAIARSDMDKALELQAKVETLDSDAVESLLLKADLTFLQKKYDEAADIYSAIIKRRPENLLYRLSQSWSLVGAEKYEEAAKTLDPVLSATPNSPQVQYLRGMVHYYMKEYGDARNLMQKVLATNSDYAPALAIAGASSYALKEYEQARSHLARLASIAPKFEQGRKLLALTQMQLGQREAAAQTLKPLMISPDDIEDDQTLRLLATAALQSGDLKSGKNYIEKAVERAPDDADLRTQLGLAKIGLGDMDEGLDDLRVAAKNNPNDTAPQIRLALTLFKEKRFDEALEVAQGLTEKYPKVSTGYVMQGMAYDYLGKPDEARTAFKKALEINPEAIDAAQNLAVMEFRNNRWEQGRKIYEDFLDKNPDNVKALLMLAIMEVRNNDLEGTEKYLKRAVEADPESLPARLVLSRFYLGTGRPQLSLQNSEEVIQDNADNLDLLMVLVQAEIGVGQFDKAADNALRLERLDTAHKYDSASYYLAYALRENGDLAGATDAIDRYVSLSPDNAAGWYLKGKLAFTEMNKADLEKAIDNLRDQAADAPQLDELAGLQAILAGDLGKAKDRLGAALDVEPSTELVLKHSAVLYEMGDVAGAEADLRAWLEKNPGDPISRMQLSRFLQQSGDREGAMKELDTLVGMYPKSWMGQNNLSLLNYDKGDLDAALKYAEAAVAIAPENYSVLDTYGTVLLAKGQTRRAADALERVVASAPQMRSSSVRLAKAYVELGKEDQAVSVLKKVLSDKTEFDGRSEGEDLLARLTADD